MSHIFDPFLTFLIYIRSAAPLSLIPIFARF